MSKKDLVTLNTLLSCLTFIQGPLVAKIPCSLSIIQPLTNLHQTVPSQSIQKLKDLCQSCQQTNFPSAVWQTLCVGCAMYLQRLLHKRLRSVANGLAKRSSSCLWLVLLLDLEMCGDFHIFVTRMVAVSISAYYSLRLLFLPLPHLNESAIQCQIRLFTTLTLQSINWIKLMVNCQDIVLLSIKAELLDVFICFILIVRS